MLVVWEVYKDFYIPMGKCDPTLAVNRKTDGIGTVPLNAAAPANPYTVYMQALEYVRHRIRARLDYDIPGDSTISKHRKYMEKLLEPLRGLRPQATLDRVMHPVLDARRYVVKLRQEPLTFFQEIVGKVVDDWDGLELDQFVHDKDREALAPFSFQDWLAAWKRCALAIGGNMKSLPDKTPGEGLEYKPFDVVRFMDQWGTAPCKPLSPAPIQVITDHSQLEEAMQLTRELHDVEANAIVEFALQFDTDNTVLQHCAELMPRQIGCIDMKDVTVKDNALVVTMSVPLGSGSPIADSLMVDELRRRAASIDKLNKCVAAMIKAVDVIWEKAEA